MKVETLIRGDVHVVMSYSLFLTYMIVLNRQLVRFFGQNIKSRIGYKGRSRQCFSGVGGGLNIFSDQSNILEVGGM